MMVDTVLFNGRISTMQNLSHEVSAIALKDGKIFDTGTDRDIRRHLSSQTQEIDLQGRRVIPGLIDSHTHIVRHGNNFALELRWDHCPSLADGLRMLKTQVERTQPGGWVRVVGGWSADQFAEKRLPTIDELNAVSEDVPIYVLHVYDRSWMNKAGLRALGIDEHYYEPFVAGHFERDDQGRPTGMILARPNAQPLYALLDMAPKLNKEQRIISTKHFFRSLNALGMTSGLDCAGGYHYFPDDYDVLQELNDRGEQTLRVGYQLFAQRPGQELNDFKSWNTMVRPDEGNDFLKCIGAGEMLVVSAYDYEDFSFPRPNLQPKMESELEPVLEFLLENRWPIRFHCTYDETAQRILPLVEKVGEKYGLHDLNWILDHGETLSEKTIDWVARLGGGISYQNRIAFQTNSYKERYGEDALKKVMPVRKMIESGIPLASGTDATRVSSYNPWLCIHWLVSGQGRGGEIIWDPENRLSRAEALQHWTVNGAWFSREEGKKGALAKGHFADFAVLDRDYMTCPEDQITDITADLTFVDGKPVFAKGDFAQYAPQPLPKLPGWSPVNVFGAPGVEPEFLSS